MTTSHRNPTMPSVPAGKPDTAVIAELAMQAGAHDAFDLTEAAAGGATVMANVLHSSQQLVLNPLERWEPTPARLRGEATVADPDAFISYVTRLGSLATTVWVCWSPTSCLPPTVTAVFNDHTGADEPGWRDHRAVLVLDPTPDWKHWVGANGDLMNQLQFAELVEDGLTAVIDPDGATLLEIAQTFHATRMVEFSSARRVASGDLQLRWNTTTSASAGRSAGELDIPEVFTLFLAPWPGASFYEVTARLRWRLHEGELSLGYRLHRIEDVLAMAVDELVTQLNGELSYPVLRGLSPAPLAALRA